MNSDLFDSCNPDDPVRYYDRDGRQISLRQWGEMKYGSDYYRIADTRVGRVQVSTVWLGLDHRFGEGPPIIFETMVFGGPHDGELERYCTEAEARLGHDHWVALQRRPRARWRAWKGNHLDDRRQTDLGEFLILAGVVGSFVAASWWFLIPSLVGGWLFGGAVMRRYLARRRRRPINRKSTTE